MTDTECGILSEMNDAAVIAAVKSDDGLGRALASESPVIFLLYGTILNIGELVKRAGEGGRTVFVHVDLIEGLTGKDISADFIAKNTGANGIISTRANIIRRAKNLGLIAIQRFFLLDSIAFENVRKQAASADAVDILPGTMPRVIGRLRRVVKKPIIASGLITDRQDVAIALASGAAAVSTTSDVLWSLKKTDLQTPQRRVIVRHTNK